ncbi:MAG TPA: hypothetical protein VKY53_01395 [Marinobacter sp.]|nr:hypothetical protein [Marinobacter sp.]
MSRATIIKIVFGLFVIGGAFLMIAYDEPGSQRGDATYSRPHPQDGTPQR